MLRTSAPGFNCRTRRQLGRLRLFLGSPSLQRTSRQGILDRWSSCPRHLRGASTIAVSVYTPIFRRHVVVEGRQFFECNHEKECASLSHSSFSLCTSGLASLGSRLGRYGRHGGIVPHACEESVHAVRTPIERVKAGDCCPAAFLLLLSIAMNVATHKSSIDSPVLLPCRLPIFRPGRQS